MAAGRAATSRVRRFDELALETKLSLVMLSLLVLSISLLVLLHVYSER
jgi:hypothetical protein